MSELIVPPIVGATRRRFPPYLVLAFFAPKRAKKDCAQMGETGRATHDVTEGG
jgi:hypothetical protein